MSIAKLRCIGIVKTDVLLGTLSLSQVLLVTVVQVVGWGH